MAVSRSAQTDRDLLITVMPERLFRQACCGQLYLTAPERRSKMINKNLNEARRRGCADGDLCLQPLSQGTTTRVYGIVTEARGQWSLAQLSR